MANTTDPFAQTVHGTNPQYLVEKITRLKIYNCVYWKEQCFGLTAATIIDKAIALKYCGGVYGGNLKPTSFLCLVLKMLQLQPEKEIIIELIKNEDFKYVRALGCFYMRLIGRGEDIYKYLEPLYNDYRKLSYRGVSGWREMHMDEFVDELLREELVCDIALPHLVHRTKLETLQGLPKRKSILDIELTETIEELQQPEVKKLKKPRLVEVAEPASVKPKTDEAAIVFDDDDEEDGEVAESLNSKEPYEKVVFEKAVSVSNPDREHFVDGKRSRHDRNDGDSTDSNRGRQREDERRRNRSRDRPRNNDRDDRRYREVDRDRERRRRSNSSDRDNSLDREMRRKRRTSYSTSSRSRSPSRSPYARRRKESSSEYRRRDRDSRSRSADRGRDRDRDRDRIKDRDRDRDRDSRGDRDSTRRRDKAGDYDNDGYSRRKEETKPDRNSQQSSNTVYEEPGRKALQVKAARSGASNEAKFEKAFGKKDSSAKSGKEITISETGAKVTITAPEGSVEYWNQIREKLGMKKLKE